MSKFTIQLTLTWTEIEAYDFQAATLLARHLCHNSKQIHTWLPTDTTYTINPVPASQKESSPTNAPL